MPARRSPSRPVPKMPRKKRSAAPPDEPVLAPSTAPARAPRLVSTLKVGDMRAVPPGEPPARPRPANPLPPVTGDPRLATVLMMQEDYDDTDQIRAMVRHELEALQPRLDEDEVIEVFQAWRSYHPQGLIHWVAIRGPGTSGALGLVEILVNAVGCRTARARLDPEAHGMDRILHADVEGIHYG